MVSSDNHQPITVRVSCPNDVRNPWAETWFPVSPKFLQLRILLTGDLSLLSMLVLRIKLVFLVFLASMLDNSDPWIEYELRWYSLEWT